MLTHRGHALSHGIVWDQIKYEMLIKKHILKHKQKLIIPRDAYITFTNEESFIRGKRVQNLKSCGEDQPAVVWEGTNLDFEVPKEPSNIIYTNLYQ